jgi:hypothetical protein
MGVSGKSRSAKYEVPRTQVVCDSGTSVGMSSMFFWPSLTKSAHSTSSCREGFSEITNLDCVHLHMRNALTLTY